MMRKFGYRVKILPDFLKEFFTFCSNCLNTLEIKLTKDMLHASCVERVLELAEMYGVKQLSFHAPKKAFYTESDYDLFLLFLDSSDKFCENICVTHFYSDIPYNKDYVTAIVDKARLKNVRLAVENVEISNELFAYLSALKHHAINAGINVCLDVGHLLYSAKRCSVTFEELIHFFKNDLWWTENVIEFHMHDFNDDGCHLNIGKGITNFEDIMRLIALFEKGCPVILETTVNNLSTQGVSEIALLKSLLHEF